MHSLEVLELQNEILRKLDAKLQLQGVQLYVQNKTNEIDEDLSKLETALRALKDKQQATEEMIIGAVGGNKYETQR